MPYVSYYYISFIVVGALFLVNLFIGVIFLNYIIAQQKEKNKFLTND